MADRFPFNPNSDQMNDSNEQIEKLQTRLDKMVEYQDYFYREINLIREEIKNLKTVQPNRTAFTPTETPKKPIPREDVPLYKPPQPKQTPNTSAAAFFICLFDTFPTLSPPV